MSAAKLELTNQGNLLTTALANDPHLAENTLSYPELVQDIPYYHRECLAEGMTIFNDLAGKPSLLVVYDSPAKNRLVGDRTVIADVFGLGLGTGG